MTRPAPPAVECYLQFLNQSSSDPRILEAAFVGNDIANGLETKEVAFFDFLRFPEAENTQGSKVASHIQRGVNY
jgi:hypothetical protein